MHIILMTASTLAFWWAVFWLTMSGVPFIQAFIIISGIWLGIAVIFKVFL